MQTVLQDALALRTRCNAGGIGEHGLASARGRLEARLGRLIDAPPPLAPAERFARHLAREFEAVFLFLRDPSLDATNWRAEHAIRPAVVTRKVCGGNRTRRGADTQQILASVVRTARQRQLDPRALFTTMLCAPELELPRFRGHLSCWEEEVSAMPKSRPPYAAEFRQQMVELVRSGRTPEALAREFEPSAQAIRNWVAQAGRDAGERTDGLRTGEREEMRRLRRENRRLREEREILAKATAWFARETGSGGSTGS